MPLPISPRRLLSLAQNLAEQAKALENATDCEVMRRAVVNRAYYAAFLYGRDKFGITTRQGVHSLVRQNIAARDAALARIYENLKALREAADYQFPPESVLHLDWEQNWIDAEASAVTLRDCKCITSRIFRRGVIYHAHVPGGYTFTNPNQ